MPSTRDQLTDLIRDAWSDWNARNLWRGGGPESTYHHAADAILARFSLTPVEDEEKPDLENFRREVQAVVTDNDGLLARYDDHMSHGNTYLASLLHPELAAALRASEEENGKLRDLNARAEEVIKGYLPTVKELEDQLAAAENVIRDALAEAQSQMDRDDMSKWGEHGRYSAGSDLHEVLSSYKPEEGKN